MDDKELSEIVDTTTEDLFQRLSSAGLVIVRKDEYENLIRVATIATKIARESANMAKLLGFKTNAK